MTPFIISGTGVHAPRTKQLADIRDIETIPAGLPEFLEHGSLFWLRHGFPLNTDS
jgi:hypothetical protein